MNLIDDEREKKKFEIREKGWISNCYTNPFVLELEPKIRVSFFDINRENIGEIDIISSPAFQVFSTVNFYLQFWNGFQSKFKILGIFNGFVR